MMTRVNYLYKEFLGLLLFAVLIFSSCTKEEKTPAVYDDGPVKITMDVTPFEGEVSTRTNVEGTGFEGGDKIRFKIICPNSSSHELGETWGSYYTITAPANLNNGAYFITGTHGSYEAQATTYIYTAMNTTDNRIYVVGDYRYSFPSSFFFADQSKLSQFKSSDVVWAQAVRQTGAREVHLNFKHKVAKLDITIVDDKGELLEEGQLSNNLILTLEGMPDIDGAEIVVGDYYADQSIDSDYSFKYMHKASCSYENNGKVIGIEVLDDTNKRTRVYALTGNPYPAGGDYNSYNYAKVPNTGTYRAYQDTSNKLHFTLYVPPCNLDPDGVDANNEGTNHAVMWLRDGTKRYKMVLNQKVFEEGVCYKLKMVVSKNPAPPADPDPDPNPDPDPDDPNPGPSPTPGS